MAVTLKDIARETGLSVGTISKYVNGAKLREKNRIIVQEAIERMGYTANEYARGLKSNRSRTIGVVLPELNSVFGGSIISHMEEILRLHGYSIMVCDCHNNAHLEAEAMGFLLAKRADGIVNIPVCHEGKHLLPAVEQNVPVVLVDRVVPGLEEQVGSVCIDNVAATREATELLLRRGHRHIGIIIGPSEIYTSQTRLAGYQQALAAWGIDEEPHLIAYSHYTVQSGYECMCALHQANPHMTAVLVTNYDTTLGAMLALNEMAIQIPQQLSVIGFDSLELARVIRPTLTVVCQPLQDMGAHVAHQVLEQLTGSEPVPHRREALAAKLWEGHSVAEPRQI